MDSLFSILRQVAIALSLLIVSIITVPQGYAAPSSALEKMELAFLGNPPQRNIETRVNHVLSLYALNRTEENYERLGSVLVLMRKEFGPSEMDILACMSADSDLAKFMKVHEAAAICATQRIR